MKYGFHWLIFVSFPCALFSWLSSSIFYGYFGCMALCVLSVDDVRDWLLDAIKAWYPSLEKGTGSVISDEITVLWNDQLVLRHELP